MLLFKFISPDAVAKVFAREDEVMVRFGLPRGYNDPYELFLQPDPPLEDEEARAFYDFFLGRVVESPVACFSRHPDSVVMWAHYAREGAGICLAFDEDAFVDQLPVAYVGDIEYRDGPATVASGIVGHALATGKRRHTIRLLAMGQRSAYFMKRRTWEYEAERRVVVPRDAVDDYDGVMIRAIGASALRYIIAGPKSEESVLKICEARARQYQLPLFRLKTGARTYQPFFVTPESSVLKWGTEQFEPVAFVCAGCGEPMETSDAEVCAWCGITDDTRSSAGGRSMLTMTLEYGIDTGVPFVFDGMTPRGHLVGRASGAGKTAAQHAVQPTAPDKTS